MGNWKLQYQSRSLLRAFFYFFFFFLFFLLSLTIDVYVSNIWFHTYLPPGKAPSQAGVPLPKFNITASSAKLDLRARLRNIDRANQCGAALCIHMAHKDTTEHCKQPQTPKLLPTRHRLIDHSEPRRCLVHASFDPTLPTLPRFHSSPPRHTQLFQLA